MREIFPEASKVTMTTLGQLGMLYWFFLLGVQLKMGCHLKQIEVKAITVAVTALISPFVVGYVCINAANLLVPDRMKTDIQLFYIGMYFAVPALSVLANTVIQHKLLQTPFGRLALSSATCANLLLTVVLQVVISSRMTAGYAWAALWRIVFSMFFLPCSHY